MEWTDIRLTVSKADAEAAEAVATMIAEGGIYIEDYSDIEEQVEQIAHVDLIEQELLDKPRDTVIIHMYLKPGDSPVETLALIAARMEAAGIPYTSETEGVEQEDWQNGWRKYYHPMDVGQRLAVVPSWQDYETSRVKLILDPGLAFGTGGHETVESVEAWRGSIDIWLADLKYVSSSLSAELSAAPDYFAQAKPAIEAMMAQAGRPVFDGEGILQKGVILRHLALPGHIDDSFAVLDQMAAWNQADPGCFIPSVMSQYTPFYKAADHGIGRRITTYEYRRVVNRAMDLGLTDGYMQQKSSAREEYTPSFDLTGI